MGTTYTFTPAEDEAASTLITFDLTAARPFVRPRPDGKPELGDVIVTTVFQVETDDLQRTTRLTRPVLRRRPGATRSWCRTGTTTSTVTTYEQLRTESTVMRVNVEDIHGASWGSFYDAVAVDDVVEWYEADDCWVRYRVTSSPASTFAATRDFGVRWDTYAPTGCRGTVSGGAASRMEWRPADVILDASMTSPVRHGQYLLIQTGWEGIVVKRTKDGPGTRHLTGRSVEPQAELLPPPHYRASIDAESPTERVRVDISDLAEARRLIPLWRDPEVPEGWTLRRAEVGTPNSPFYGYKATYVDERGGPTVFVYIYHPDSRPFFKWVSDGRGSYVYEARTIDEHQALVKYSPPGPNHDPYTRAEVWIPDEATGITYATVGMDPSLRGANIDPLIEITRSLYRTAGR